MIDMMRAVIDAGTGARLRSKYKITADMAGKTGTTQNNSDAWFIGYTPSLVTGCWVGGEERSIHFTRMADGQGAALALPIYGLYMNKVYADKDHCPECKGSKVDKDGKECKKCLPYSQDEKFYIPEDFNACESLLDKQNRLMSGEGLGGDDEETGNEGVPGGNEGGIDEGGSEEDNYFF